MLSCLPPTIYLFSDSNGTVAQPQTITHRIYKPSSMQGPATLIQGNCLPRQAAGMARPCVYVVPGTQQAVFIVSV